MKNLNNTVVVFAAHLDNVLGCSGMIAKLTQEGSSSHCVLD